MSNTDLRATRSIALLEQLKSTVADFAKREETLTRELRDKRFFLSRGQREAMDTLDAELAERSKGVAALFDEAAAVIRAKYEARRDWIERAHHTLAKSLPRRAQAAREAFVGKLQMGKIVAERKMASDIHAADVELSEFLGRLEEQRNVLAHTKAQAWKLFGGYGAFMKLLQARPEGDAPKKSHPVLLAQMQEQLAKAADGVAKFSAFGLPAFFRVMQLPILLPFIIFGAAAAAFLLGPSSYILAGIAGTLVIALILGVYFAGKNKAASTAHEIATALGEAAKLHDAAAAAATQHQADEHKKATDEFEATKARIEADWSKATTIEADYLATGNKKYSTQHPRALEKNKSLFAPRHAAAEAERDKRMGVINADVGGRRSTLDAQMATDNAAHTTMEQTAWAALNTDWLAAVTPIYRDIAAANEAVSADFPAWTPQSVEKWTAPAGFTPAVRIGRLEADVKTLAGTVPARLALPGAPHVAVPISLTFPDAGSLLFESEESGTEAISGALTNTILRLLTTMKPGKVAFTILDPVGLGKNFAGLMHLADHEESVVNRRIWTQRDQIEDRVSELNDHVEKVIQMYLRNEYATIADYNAQAGVVSEKYHFLVVADFPAEFSETAIKKLQSIIASGPRCGVFTLIHWDERVRKPDGFLVDELRKNALRIRGGQRGMTLDGQPAAGTVLALDVPPDAELAAQLVHKIGKASVDSNRVQVPFTQIAPPEGQLWSHDTTTELRVPVGRTGATKLQYLAIGKGTRQHALFAGKTGSGKSTLFHVIITNLALWASPEQAEFYLIDFKKGVEFKCYATHHLPHARVIAIESDREFGLSVLQRVDDELKRRGEMFRKLGAQDIAGYKRAGGTEAIPRSLLLIDEFQEFFTEDDEVAQNAAVLLDRIVRQGRAFGIHVLLGSQTLGGAFTINRATMGQMAIRVALQCNEADAHLIMDDSNSAPRLLTRPGEAIYNDAAGAIEGNSPFQVVWINDDERDAWLVKVNTLAQQRGLSENRPIVFEGNAPADVRDNGAFARARSTRATAAPAGARIWLGEPNSIKGPTEAVFHRQTGAHLLIIGQREDAATTMLGLAMLALAAQFPAGGVKIILLHAAPPDSGETAFFNRIAATSDAITIADPHGLPAVMSELSADVKARGADGGVDAPRVFLLVHGLQKFKKLRAEDDFDFSVSDSGESPAKQLGTVITEGSSVGVHLIATVDSFNNVNRHINRKTMSEIEMRVVFQMSTSDSASLIDSPKAGALGLHRALLYNEQAGTLETFRPYGEPVGEWIDGK